MFSSTDSQLKLWNINKPHCLRTFKGHINEKNFVGLASNGDYVACGKSVAFDLSLSAMANNACQDYNVFIEEIDPIFLCVCISIIYGQRYR